MLEDALEDYVIVILGTTGYARATALNGVGSLSGPRQLVVTIKEFAAT